MPKAQPSVYYAINDNPLYVAFAERSVRDLRKYNSTIHVRVVVYGKLTARQAESFSRLRAEVIRQPSVDPREGTFLKWKALPLVSGDHDLIFLDADTFIFDDVRKLIRATGKADFAARRESGCQKDQGKEIVGNFIVRHQMNAITMTKVRKKLGYIERTVFNTGVMILRPAAQSALSKSLDLFESLTERFRADKIPYPSLNPHILEEIVFTLVLGRLPQLKCGVLTMRDTPWYIEWKGGLVAKPGIVLHTWTDYYPFCLRDLDGPSAVRRAPFKGLIAPRYVP